MIRGEPCTRRPESIHTSRPGGLIYAKKGGIKDIRKSKLQKKFGYIHTRALANLHGANDEWQLPVLNVNEALGMNRST